jgi:hypothetical protein
VLAEVRFCLGGIPFGHHLVYYCTPLPWVRQRLISLVPHLGVRGPPRTYGTPRSRRPRSASNGVRASARLDRGLPNRSLLPCRVLTDTSRHEPLANHYSRSVSPQTSSTNSRLYGQVGQLPTIRLLARHLPNQRFGRQSADPSRGRRTLADPSSPLSHPVSWNDAATPTCWVCRLLRS